MNLKVCGYSQIFDPQIWGRDILAADQVSNLRKFSLQKIFHQFAKVFSLESFPQYGTLK